MGQDGISGGHHGPAVPPQEQVTPWGRPSRKAAQPAPQAAAPPVAPMPPAAPAPPPFAQAPEPPPLAVGPVPPPLAVGPVPPPPAPGRGRAVLIGLLVGLLLIAGGGGVAWLLLGGDDQGGSRAAASSSERSRPADATTTDGDEDQDRDESGRTTAAPRTSGAGTASTSSAPRVDPEVQAAAELERLRTVSLQRLSLDGRWVAQVASKAVGITDPLQTTASGSNTFMAIDILAESLAARRLADPTSVMTLQSTDFGKVSRWSNGQPFWVTVVDAGFQTSEQAAAWCDQAFASLTPEQRNNTCAPRTLVPPYN